MIVSPPRVATTQGASPTRPVGGISLVRKEEEETSSAPATLYTLISLCNLEACFLFGYFFLSSFMIIFIFIIIPLSLVFRRIDFMCTFFVVVRNT